MRRPSARILLVPLAVLAIGACNAIPGLGGPTAVPGGGGSAGQPAGDEPIAPPPGNPGPAGPAPAGGALSVVPEPGILDPRPHAWDHIDVSADGRTLTVYYWGGVEDCYGLDRVDVARDADGVLTVTVLEGSRPPGDQICIDIALLKSTVVTLDDPLVLSQAP